MTARRATDIPATPQPSRSGPPLGPVALGGALVVVGLAWLLDNLGLVELRWAALLPVALIAVAILLLLGARRGASGGLIAAGIVLSVLVLGQITTPLLSPLGGLGDRLERPLSATELDSPYRHGLGTLTLDLRGITLAEATELEASVALGRLEVRLPEGMTAEVVARSGAGEVTIGEDSESGVGVRTERTVGDAPPELTIELSVGLGAVEVAR